MLSFSKKGLLVLTLLLSDGITGVVKAMYGQYGQLQQNVVFETQLYVNGHWIDKEVNISGRKDVTGNALSNMGQWVQWSPIKAPNVFYRTMAVQQFQQPVQPVQKEFIPKGETKEEKEEQIRRDMLLRYSQPGVWEEEEREMKELAEQQVRWQQLQQQKLLRQQWQQQYLLQEELRKQQQQSVKQESFYEKEELNPFFKKMRESQPSQQQYQQPKSIYQPVQQQPVQQHQMPVFQPVQKQQFIPQQQVVMQKKSSKFGGILPYAIETNNFGGRTVYFLQGKEDGTGEWADFGGKADPNEVNPFAEDIAKREGHEETVAILSEQYIEAKIIDAKKNGRTMNGLNFIIDITDMVGVNADQISRDAFLNKLRNERQKFVKANKAYKYLEKTDFRWIKREDLINAINSPVNDLRKSAINAYKRNIQVLSNI